MIVQTKTSTVYYPKFKTKATDWISGNGRIRYYRGSILLNRSSLRSSVPTNR